jgi:hypothetical protein
MISMFSNPGKLVFTVDSAVVIFVFVVWDMISAFVG